MRAFTRPETCFSIQIGVGHTDHDFIKAISVQRNFPLPESHIVFHSSLGLSAGSSLWNQTTKSILELISGSQRRTKNALQIYANHHRIELASDTMTPTLAQNRSIIVVAGCLQTQGSNWYNWSSLPIRGLPDRQGRRKVDIFTQSSSVKLGMIIQSDTT